MVWRRARGLDDLHVVLPGAAAGGLRLCAFHLALAQAARPGHRAPRSCWPRRWRCCRSRRAIPGNRTAAAIPTLQILALLAVSLGLPYFVLSATGPLIQQWFSRANPGASPYRLYALSNVGSLLALVSYPFYFETHFARNTQATLWGWGLAVYVVCCGFCAVKAWKAESAVRSAGSGASRSRAAAADPASRLDAATLVNLVTLDQLLWLLLPACASVLLLATTNKLCQDVAVIPFLWVLPLALYLLSFVICFDSPRWYMRLPSRLP